MELDLLTAISPIDGRYRGKTDALAAYFSEFALIKYRVQVEVEYFITLCELPLPQLKGVDKNVFETLRNIYRNFSEADAQRIKDIESVTNHDVKAVEYFLKEEFDKMGGMDDYKEFIHFGLTSQDINNTSVPLSIKEALEQVYYPQIEELIAQLRTYAEEWTAIPMLAKTHGQPASPTRLGKEVMVFVYRLERQLATLKSCPLTAKFGGATGNYNAHHVAYPEFDWKAFGNRFVAEKLGLEREEYTTQISNYDNLSAVFDAMKRINTVMIDMNRDFWQYMIVGGMPKSLSAYMENNRSFEMADMEKRDILTLYRNDIMKINSGYRSSVLSIFDQIPAFLSRSERRVVMNRIEKGASFPKYHDTFFWLSDSMIANECFNCSDPNVGLSLNEDRTYVKCYMGDTGLLISHTFDENEISDGELYREILLGKLSVNEGMFYENVIAQMLVAAGHKLYFYTRYNEEKHRNDVEIDFILSNQSKLKYKIFPIEVKSNDKYIIRSLTRFNESFHQRIGGSYVIHPKNLSVKEGVVYLPAYMTFCL